jgi:2-desacetyl-2-hydroxyethyl bacteriochlorophyllide A dehydrogenase
MKALRIEAPGAVRLATAPEPKVGPEDVLLRIRTVGFCGSDLNTYRGLNPLVAYPRIPGHEIVATVEALGAAVPPERLRPGTLVTVLPYTSCGRCSACRQGRVNTCRDNQTLGVQRDGAMTERIAARWGTVLSAPSLSPRALALAEPLSVGAHAVARARIRAGERVLVIGCGAVGLGAVAVAAARDAVVIAADVDDHKLELGRLAGATHTLNTRTAELGDFLREVTGGDGPDVVIEAVGLPETFLAAVQEVAVAGRVVYIGYAKAPVSYDSSLFVRKELDILGSRNATAEDFTTVIQLLADGRFPVDQAVTRTVALADAAEALQSWHAAPDLVTRIHVQLD